MPDRVITIQAPSKINLALSVGPRGADGMHPVCSWMVTVDLVDDLEVKRLPPDRFSRYAILWHEEARHTTEIDWSITSDLAVRAHLALEQHVGHRLPVQLKLEKRIPVGGGLGGGSSNAAAMLHAVNALYDLELDASTLANIAAPIGSDIPFLVHGGSAIVEGLGERVAPHEDPLELHLVIALTRLECATAHVYRRFDEIAPGPLCPDAVTGLADGAKAAGRLRPDALFNDLTRAAIRTESSLEDHIAHLGALAERPSHVAGSGSSIFVLCDDALHAEYLAREFEQQHGIPAIAAKSVEGGSTSLDAVDLAAADRDQRSSASID